MEKQTILFIIGSMRRNSFNRQLADEAAAILADAGAEVQYLEYRDIPYMNQDIEFPAPRSVARIREQVMEADGIWIFTPEYNGGVPGVLKNLLDWLSRSLSEHDPAGRSAIAGKPVTVSGAGGSSATAHVRGELNKLLGFIRMRAMTEPETGIALSAQAFGTDRLTLASGQREALRNQAETFLQFIAE